MIVGAKGLKAVGIIIIILAFFLVLFVIALQIFLIILPIVFVLALGGYLWRLFSKNKKGTIKEKETNKAQPAKHIDVKYKVKE